MNAIDNVAPKAEVEVYRDIIYNATRQLSILKQYDQKFIFLETQLLQHLQQLDLTLSSMDNCNG